MTTMPALARATTARASARERYDAADAAWREEVRQATAVHSLAEVAEAAGITRGRVAQIRDGRR